MLKLFRIADFWNRKPLENPADRIERALLDRTRRLMAGLSVDEEFKQVSGSLVVARGRGKSNRVLFCDSVVEPIPDVIRDNCLEIVQSEAVGPDFRSCIGELADVQAKVVESLKRKAAKYVDRILAISVTDPGLWQSDFDGVKHYTSFCDATRLAERTGVSVIDAWPDRDIAVGGKGYPLEPLGLWLLLTDRNQRIARQVNVVVRIEEQTTGYVFPPSDGLDAEVPNLSSVQTQGMDLIDGLQKVLSLDSLSPAKVRQLLVSGVHSKKLIDQWSQIDASKPDCTVRMLESVNNPGNETLSTEELLCTAMNWISGNCEGMVRTSLRRLKIEHAQRRVDLKHRIATAPELRVSSKGLLDAFDDSTPDFSKPGKILIDAPDLIGDAFVSHLQNQFPDAQVTGSWQTQLGVAAPSQDRVDPPSLIAAMLGFLHVDQMPANIPTMTGARQQRILGRLTPGRPNSWRNLLREMADHEPPAMKLRDAV